MEINNIEWFFPEAPYVIDKNITTRSWSYEISEGEYDVTKTRKQKQFNNQELEGQIIK